MKKWIDPDDYEGPKLSARQIAYLEKVAEIERKLFRYIEQLHAAKLNREKDDVRVLSDIVDRLQQEYSEMRM